MQTILLNDALGVLEQRQPFQIKFVSCNLSKKTGGKFIELHNAVKTGAVHNQKNNETISVRSLNNQGHPYPVHIHLITEVNHQRIII
jgi:type 1 fimbria pilin